MTAGPGIESGTHWWKASALITTPTLLPKFILNLDETVGRMRDVETGGGDGIPTGATI